MNTGSTVLLCLVAGVGAGVAVAAGTNVDVIVPAAAGSVAAASLLLLGVIERTRWPSVDADRSASADPGRVRSSLTGGAWGRAELVALLDHLERSERGARTGGTSPEEVARLQALSREEFRGYLGARIGELERRT
jgi:hypothetical protein